MKKIVSGVIAVVLLIFILFLFLGYTFTQSFYEEQNVKLYSFGKVTEVNSDTAGLPQPVKSYLQKVMVKNFDEIYEIQSRQKGLFRTSTTSEWAEITAVQTHTIDQPGFVWDGEISFFPGLWVRGIDSYIDGIGNMLIKLNSSLTLGDASGNYMDASSLGRYVSEMPLFPMAMFENKYVEWKENDSVSATMIFNDKKNTIKMDFFFNDEGLIYKAFTNDRYLTSNAGYIKTPYTIRYDNYKNLDGCLIPTDVSVEWNTEKGDFEYGRFTITEVKYISTKE